MAITEYDKRACVYALLNEAVYRFAKDDADFSAVRSWFLGESAKLRAEWEEGRRAAGAGGNLPYADS